MQKVNKNKKIIKIILVVLAVIFLLLCLGAIYSAKTSSCIYKCIDAENIENCANICRKLF